MRVHHLSCGTMCPFGGSWFDGSDGPLWSTGTLICHVLLLETDAHGLVLVDSGIGLQDVRHPGSRLGGVFDAVARPVLDPAQTAVRQVEAMGFDAADVRHVVLTHLDLDHAGGVADFEDATIHVLAEEHRSAFEPPTWREKMRYRDEQFAHGPRFATYAPRGEPWMGFPCVRDLDELPPEILFIPLVGHSRGHAAVAVQAGDRWLLHCGDAYFHRDEMRSEDWGCPPGLSVFQRLVAFDRGAMEDNKRRLRELKRASTDVEIFSAHDVVELARLSGSGASSPGPR